jgi:hypothetical protein
MKIGLCVRAVRERKKVVKQKAHGPFCYFNASMETAVLGGSEMIPGTSHELRDVMNCDMFRYFAMCSLGAGDGKNKGFPIET